MIKVCARFLPCCSGRYIGAEYKPSSVLTGSVTIRKAFDLSGIQ